MQVVTKPDINIDFSTTTIYVMRHSGATLQQIADTIGRTKERVRQILVKNYGSTKHKKLSTEKLCKLSGLSRSRIVELYKDDVITPVKEWNTNNGQYFLWPLSTVEQIAAYYSSHRLCKICYRPIPKGRRIYCSEQCYREGHKYRHMSIEAKKKQLGNIRRYREKCKLLKKGFSS